MKAVLFFIFLFPFQQTLASSVSLKCSQVFRSDKHNLSQWMEAYEAKSLQSFRDDASGSWVKLNNGQWARYQIFGPKTGPLRLHSEGLGGQTETSLKSEILKDHSEFGPVLVIELDGQGAREVHRRLQLKQEGQETTHGIPYDENVSMLVEAIEKISATEGLTIDNKTLISGHSFGGLTISGLMKALDIKHTPTAQFLATGVANFNHRFVSEIEKRRLSFWTSLAVWQYNAFKVSWNTVVETVESMTGMKVYDSIPSVDVFAIQNGVKSFSDPALFGHLADDQIKMESAVALTLGAADVDAIKDPAHYPPGTNVQILSGQSDAIVFSMLHWELAQASIEAGHSTTLVMVEGTGHYMPMELNEAQKKAVRDLSQNPNKYSGYYMLTEEGEMRVLNQEESLALYKASSLETWEKQKETLRQIFQSFGQTVRYPEDWR